MLGELAIGTLLALGVARIREDWGIWPLRRTWAAVGLRTVYPSKIEHVPLVVANARTSYGRCVVVSLPSGISTSKFLSHLPHMEEQMRCTIQAEVTHSTVKLHVIRRSLPTNLPYTTTFLEDWEGKGLPVPVGDSGIRFETVDLLELPHLLVAGNTGSGKSTFLHGLIVSAILSATSVCIIDLKQVEYHVYASSALVADTNRTASALLSALNAEMDRRLTLLKQHNLVHAKGFPREQMPYIVLVIDELAELSDKTSQEALNRLCRLARAAGICVVAATQRPSHTIYSKFTDTRALFAGRMCFPVASGDDSRLVLGDESAARLPRNIPGRAIFQHSGNLTVQVMNLNIDDARILVRNAVCPKVVVPVVEQHAKVLKP